MLLGVLVSSNMDSVSAHSHSSTSVPCHEPCCMVPHTSPMLILGGTRMVFVLFDVGPATWLVSIGVGAVAVAAVIPYCRL